jgi:hypothetical protein
MGNVAPNMEEISPRFSEAGAGNAFTAALPAKGMIDPPAQPASDP